MASALSVGTKGGSADCRVRDGTSTAAQCLIAMPGHWGFLPGQGWGVRATQCLPVTDLLSFPVVSPIEVWVV